MNMNGWDRTRVVIMVAAAGIFVTQALNGSTWAAGAAVATAMMWAVFVWGPS